MNLNIPRRSASGVGPWISSMNEPRGTLQTSIRFGELFEMWDFGMVMTNVFTHAIQFII